MDAIDLLVSDHERVKELFEQYDSLGDDAVEEKRRLAETVIRELMIHERIEEDIFYPAFRSAADKEGRDLVAESRQEHHVVDLLIDELAEVDLEDEAFDAKMKVLMENVKHHIGEEEGEMFPDARKLLKDDLEPLGIEMAEYKESLRSLEDLEERPAQR